MIRHFPTTEEVSERFYEEIKSILLFGTSSVAIYGDVLFGKVKSRLLVPHKTGFRGEGDLWFSPRGLMDQPRRVSRGTEPEAFAGIFEETRFFLVSPPVNVVLACMGAPSSTLHVFSYPERNQHGE